ncbi:hypothetical protein BDN72DRAFT_905407 [Pluteus cervinus]|uniref:Uncharacterized protein n=1 Tax=Pluteus cervinus TaxID=181527 RepID=A0ACD3A240_9AGAR|nr:hypothetical protein BDN72DRAFT_905407 [Pluteus cervinus]
MPLDIWPNYTMIKTGAESLKLRPLRSSTLQSSPVVSSNSPRPDVLTVSHLVTRTEGNPLAGIRHRHHDDIVARLLKVGHEQIRTHPALSYTSSMLDGLMYIFSRTLDPNHTGIPAMEPKFDLSLLYGNRLVESHLPRNADPQGSFATLDFQDFKEHLDSTTTTERIPNTAIVILFCFMQNHNSLASKLREQPDKQDSEEWIFSTACIINCLQFQNVIIEDVLHGLTGLPLVGPWTKLDIGTLNSESGRDLRDDEARLLYQIFTFESPRNLQNSPGNDPNPVSLDQALHTIREAIKNPTKAYQIHENAHDNLLTWLEAHPMVTFNEYRRFLGLNPLSSFTEWTHMPEVEDLARRLYKSIDSVELLPGLYFERPFHGSGFNLGYTHSYALFVDIVKILRRDGIRKDMKEDRLTKWGLEQVKPFQTQDRFKFCGQLSRLLLHNLPSLSSFNNVYTHFPLSLSKNTEQCLEESNIGDGYDLFFPSGDTPLELKSLDIIKMVFNNPLDFNTLYGDELKPLTGGYGFMLGFDDDPGAENSHHDLDVYMTCYALMPDVRAYKEYSMYFKNKVYKCLEKKVNEAKKTGSRFTSVDLAEEVIIPYGLNLDSEPSLLEKIQGCFKRRNKGPIVREKDLGDYFKDFLNIFSVVFNKVPPEDRQIYREAAKLTAEKLSVIIKNRIKEANAEIDKQEEGWFPFFWRIFLEYAAGRPLPPLTNHSFLDQLITANHSAVGRFPLVASFTSMEHFYKPRDGDNPEKFTRKLGKERLEQERLASNTLAFAVVAAVNYAQACLHVLEYYLSHPEHLKELQLNLSQDNAELMRYCHEALRLNQPLFLFRRATKAMDVPGMEVKAGDIVYANLWSVHQALKGFDVKRQEVPSLYGVGFHRCPASNFVKETMPEFLRPILQLLSLQPDPQKTLQVSHLPLPCRSGNQEEKAGLFQRTYTVGTNSEPYPWTLPVRFETESFKMPEEKKSYRNQGDLWVMKVIEGVVSFFVLIVFCVVSCYFIIPSGSDSDVTQAASTSIPSAGLLCSPPTNVIQKWAVNTFFPDADGQPAPVEYTLDYKRPHRLSLVDIDHRDLMMAVHVDDVLRGQTTDFTLDKNTDCGEDLGSCLGLNYSGGVVIVPPGKHTVKIVWAGKEFIPGTHSMDWGNDYSRRYKWQIEGCS